MIDIQEIFNRIEKTKKERKDIRSAYKEALDSSEEYKEIKEKMNTLKMRKKQIEASIKESFSGELTKLDDLKIDLESDAAMLSDMALSKFIKGETVEVTDQYNNTYQPLFIVRFKKA